MKELYAKVGQLFLATILTLLLVTSSTSPASARTVVAIAGQTSNGADSSTFVLILGAISLVALSAGFAWRQRKNHRDGGK